MNLFLAINNQLTDNQPQLANNLQTISKHLADDLISKQLTAINRNSQTDNRQPINREFFALEDLAGNKVRVNSLGRSAYGQPAEHVKRSRVKTARFTNFFDCGRVWTVSRTGFSSCGRVFLAPLAHV